MFEFPMKDRISHRQQYQFRVSHGSSNCLLLLHRFVLLQDTWSGSKIAPFFISTTIKPCNLRQWSPWFVFIYILFIFQHAMVVCMFLIFFKLFVCRMSY